jgi:protein-disulfide isomerase
MKQIIIAVVVVVGIIVGAMLFGGKSDVVTAETSNNFYGQEEGIVTITEYGDFQCPACAGFYPIVSVIKETFKDQVRFEYKHFPLVQIHTNAIAAHRAAQAAATQGKFWEMHDRLYEQQQAWNETGSPASIFQEYARAIGLDMEKYDAEVGTSETLAVINADIALGKDNDVSSTPTFLIDGKLIEDLTALSTVQGFTQVIQDAIDAKNNDADTTVEASTEPENTEVQALPDETEATAN